MGKMTATHFADLLDLVPAPALLRDSEGEVIDLLVDGIPAGSAVRPVGADWLVAWPTHAQFCSDDTVGGWVRRYVEDAKSAARASWATGLRWRPESPGGIHLPGTPIAAPCSRPASTLTRQLCRHLPEVEGILREKIHKVAAQRGLGVNKVIIHPGRAQADFLRGDWEISTQVWEDPESPPFWVNPRSLKTLKEFATSLQD